MFRNPSRPAGNSHYEVRSTIQEVLHLTESGTMWLSTQRLRMRAGTTQQEQKDALGAVIIFQANDLKIKRREKTKNAIC